MLEVECASKPVKTKQWQNAQMHSMIIQCVIYIFHKLCALTWNLPTLFSP